MIRPWSTLSGVTMVFAFVCVSVAPVSAFKILTHGELNVRAGDIWDRDGYLVNELSLQGGIGATVRGRPIREWLREGGGVEDKYFGSELLGALNRSTHHFHNPLLPWNVAGLSGRCAGLVLNGLASVRWAQTSEQQALAGESATWADARGFFRDTLTLGAKGQRDEALAKLFTTLGQQMHLIADLAVPAHVRNDVHCTPNAEDFEVWAAQGPAVALISGMLDQEIVKPPRSIFGFSVPAGEDVATVPVARLWDRDLYDGTNPGDTLLDTIGLAEFTNANFFSRETIFSPNFPFPARTSLTLRPTPEPEPKQGELRRYFRKGADGAVVEHIAVPSALYESLPDALKDKKIGLDDKVFADYGRLLFPRAVGYSTALLDYFFRGRLDVRLGDDGTRMVGKNASPDPLGGGTLSVYAEKGDGTRTLAGTASVSTVAPNDPLPEIQLTVPEGTERFVAVYEGNLGSERAAGQFRGAVAGKVVSSVRVEEVFTDGASWQLRTPDAVITLPLSPSDYVDVRWAEGENFLIARTPFGVDLPNQVVVFEVLRAPNSVAPLTVTTPEGERVQITERERVSIPIGLAAGTTVELQQQIHYRQQLGRFERTTTFTFTGLCGETPRICYTGTSQDINPVTFTNVVETIAPFTVTIPLVLDAAHNLDLNTDIDFLFTPTPYFWELVEVRRDRAGRLLGLVKVFVTQPGPTAPRVSLPFYEVDPGTGELTEVRQVTLAPYFPAQVTPIWVLVDLKQAQVVGSTAGPHVVVSSLVTHEGEPWSRLGDSLVDAMVWGRDVRIFVGGEDDRTERTDWLRVPLLPLYQDDSIGDVSDLHIQLGQTGCCFSGLSTDTLAADQLRPEIAAAVGPLLATSITATSTTRDLKYACHAFTTLCLIVRVGQTVKDLAGPGILRTARLAGAAERLVLLASRQHNPTSTETLAVWDRPAASARLLVSPVQGFYTLDDVTTQSVLATLFSVPGFTVVSGSVLALDPTRPSATVPDQDLRIGFALLEPSYLYDVAALKFVETTPVFRVTTLPTALAPVPDNPVGDYHVIPGR